MDKLVSVIIPTFNRRELTNRAVESIAATQSSLVEIIVVDDCGSDPYLYGNVNPSGIEVRVIRLGVNVGAGQARKVGVAQASAMFIGFLDSDDFYDEGWIDYVLNLIKSDSKILNCHVLITGIVKGEKRAGAIARAVLANIPQSFQLFASRIVATLFNPFYIQSVVVSKELCVFKDGLRYCEDYYSTAFALFRADKIFLPKIVACHLGRTPNSVGGLSSAKKMMFRGEMQTRLSILKESGVPVFLKLLVPIGISYQYFRVGFKSLFGIDKI